MKIKKPGLYKQRCGRRVEIIGKSILDGYWYGAWSYSENQNYFTKYNDYGEIVNCRMIKDEPTDIVSKWSHFSWLDRILPNWDNKNIIG